jgi:hypothetical protein
MKYDYSGQSHDGERSSSISPTKSPQTVGALYRLVDCTIEAFSLGDTVRALVERSPLDGPFKQQILAPSRRDYRGATPRHEVSWPGRSPSAPPPTP